MISPPLSSIPDFPRVGRRLVRREPAGRLEASKPNLSKLSRARLAAKADPLRADLDQLPRAPPASPGFPRSCLGATACWAQVARELYENTLPVAVAAGLDGVLSADHHHVVAGGGAGGKAMGLVAAVQEILKRSVEGKAIEGLQFFDRR